MVYLGNTRQMVVRNIWLPTGYHSADPLIKVFLKPVIALQVTKSIQLLPEEVFGGFFVLKKILWFDRLKADSNSKFSRKKTFKNSSSPLTPKVLVEHLGRGKSSSESAVGHLDRGDRNRLGWLGQVRSRTRKKYYIQQFYL